jgi:hypothetical protein
MDLIHPNHTSVETIPTHIMKSILPLNEEPTFILWERLEEVSFIPTNVGIVSAFSVLSGRLTLSLGNQYPHSFPNDDSKGVKLTFPKDCPANDDSRYEFPLMNGSPYDGGKNNVKQGDERVVFYYEDGEISYDGNPQVYYCGIMTHKGAAPGGFLLC